MTTTEKQNQFSRKFGNYVCAGDTISATVGPLEIVARIVRDEDHKIDDDDCHSTDPEDYAGAPPDALERAQAARRAWFRDEWFYCGVVLSVWLDNRQLDDHAAALWGIECNYPTAGENDYLTTVANELLAEAIDAGLRAFDGLRAELEAAAEAIAAVKQQQKTTAAD